MTFRSAEFLQRPIDRDQKILFHHLRLRVIASPELPCPPSKSRWNQLTCRFRIARLPLCPSTPSATNSASSYTGGLCTHLHSSVGSNIDSHGETPLEPDLGIAAVVRQMQRRRVERIQVPERQLHPFSPRPWLRSDVEKTPRGTCHARRGGLSSTSE